MKKITLILSLLIATLTASAVPAKRGVWKNIRLTDGTEVRVQRMGDENLHFWESSQGERFVFNKTRQAYEKADMTQLQARAARRSMRHANTRKANLARLKNMTQTNGRRKASDRFRGTKRGLVILVNFTDSKFKTGHNAALYKRILNEEGFTSSEGFKGSVHDYFKEQSLGAFDLQFDVVGPIQLKNGYAYYGSDDDALANEMIIEACKGADSQVNFADYDWDGDGFVEHVNVLYAGYGEADYEDENVIWPHEYELSGYGHYDDDGNPVYDEPLELDGVKIDTYSCSNEITAQGTIDGIGTFCHEFSHCLGYPDMYDTSYQGWFGMGEFDLMDGGAYNGDGFTPAGYTAWERMVAGWLDPIELDSEDKSVTGMKSLTEGGEAYIMYNKANRNEYYLLENRQKVGFDTQLPDEGLLITHVDYDEESFAKNIVNTVQTMHYDEAYAYIYNYYTQYAAQYGLTLEDLLEYFEMTAEEFDQEAKDFAEEQEDAYNPFQRMTIFHADNDDDKAYYDSDSYSYDKQTTSTDLYPIAGNNVLDNNSTPAAKLHSANSNGRKYMNHGVQDIAMASDGTISFNYKAVSNVVYPAIGTELFHETFDQCSGTGGNDGKWNGSVASSAAKFAPDYEDWEVYVRASEDDDFAAGQFYGGQKCTKVGTSKALLPVVFSPFFTFEGEAKVTIRVAPWVSTKDGKDIEIYLEDYDTEEYVLGVNETMADSKWNEYTFDITGEGNQYYLSFWGTGRFFIDDVNVVYTAEPTITAIKQVDTEKQLNDNRIYTLDGRYVGKNLNALQHGIYIVGGKKVVK